MRRVTQWALIAFFGIMLWPLTIVVVLIALIEWAFKDELGNIRQS